MTTPAKPAGNGGAPKTAKAKDAKPEPEDPCGLCWPDGWPAEDTHSAGCVHGSWIREVPARS